MNNKKFTIKDIAKLSGVSKGTVDRVLHRRGKVSKKAQEKVEKVLKEIDFQPNPIARNLKNNKLYRIGVLMPNNLEDPYWIPAYQGIKEAAEEFNAFGVIVEVYFYSLNIEKSFIDKSEEAIGSNPDAILMAPLFQSDARTVFEKCQEKKIVVALFNNYIDKLNGKIFIGQDLYQSGRVAASLLAKIVGKGSEIGIVHINLEPHMQLKENGFKDYFVENGLKYDISTHFFDAQINAHFECQLIDFFTNYPNTAALFVTNSKSYRIIEMIQDRKIIIVGYDLLEENLEYLKNGRIHFLIHQKPKRQAYLGISYLAEHFLFGKKNPESGITSNRHNHLGEFQVLY